MGNHLDAETKLEFKIDRLYEMICVIGKETPLSPEANRQFKAASLEFLHFGDDLGALKLAREELNSA